MAGTDLGVVLCVPSVFVCRSEFVNPADADGVDEGEVWYYRHSMVRFSRLRFQLIPGNTASHEGTAQPNHDAANLRHVIEVARITQIGE